MSQDHTHEPTQFKKEQIQLTGKVKQKRLLKSGVLRKKSHLSAKTRVKQAKKDQLIFGNNEEPQEFIESEIEINPPVIKKTKNRRPKKSQDAEEIDRLRFIGIPTSKALDVYVRRHCQSLLKRISARPDRYHLKFRVQPIAKNFEGAISYFQVDGGLVITGRKTLRASAEGDNIKQAVDKVIEALEKQLRRETEKRERSRKTMGRTMELVREHTWEFRYNQKIDEEDDWPNQSVE